MLSNALEHACGLYKICSKIAIHIIRSINNTNRHITHYLNTCNCYTRGFVRVCCPMYCPLNCCKQIRLGLHTATTTLTNLNKHKL